MLAITPIKSHNPSFGIFFNNVNNEDGEIRYRGDTVICRDDLYFPDVIDFLDNKYKNTPKVNVIIHACSDGEEVYSFLGVLISKLKEKAAKFLPLKAKDIDREHLKLAKRGVYNITNTEFLMANEYMNGEFFNFFEIMPKQGSNDPRLKNTKTIKVEYSLKSLVDFKQSDILTDVLKINLKNTVLFARNFWPYLSHQDRLKLAKNLSNKMDSTSTLIIGDYDKECNTDEILKAAGFVETAVDNVYEKSTNINSKTNIYNYQKLYLYK